MSHRSWIGDARSVAAQITDQLIDLRADMASTTDHAIAAMHYELQAALAPIDGPVAVVIEWDVVPRARVVPGATTLTATADTAGVAAAAHSLR
jgi:hypothetical protein